MTHFKTRPAYSPFPLSFLGRVIIVLLLVYNVFVKCFKTQLVLFPPFPTSLYCVCVCLYRPAHNQIKILCVCISTIRNHNATICPALLPFNFRPIKTISSYDLCLRFCLMLAFMKSSSTQSEILISFQFQYSFLFPHQTQRIFKLIKLNVVY